MILQPSMSRSALLLECSYAFGQELAQDATNREAADYGSAFHDVLARVISSGWGMDLLLEQAGVAAAWWQLDASAAEEITAHVSEAVSCLRAWLLGPNPFRANFLHRGATILVEQAFALRDATARKIRGPTAEGHHYEDLRPGELAGTADLVIVPSRALRNRVPLLVLDHKTGQDAFYEPLKKAQLLSLGRAAALALKAPAGVIVGVLHARRRGIPAVYADKVPRALFEEHARGLSRALGRIGDGSMRPGAWCTRERCPAQSVCPARDAELLARSGDVLSALVAAGGVLADEHARETLVPGVINTKGLERVRQLGALYRVVQQAEKLAARARAEIRQEVQAGALPETPDGKYIVLRKFSRENLSKSSVLRAYGKLAGERTLARLRKDGAIESSEVESLHVEDDKGGGGG